MNTKNLHYFLAVIEHGSMTKAADHLYITQPAISRAINDLEKQFNTQLFYRNTKPLQLTKDGEILKKHSLSILEQLNSIQGEMLSPKKIEKLKIGATLTIGNYILPAIIKSIESCYKVSTYSMVENTESIKQHLLSHRLDFAIIEGNIYHKDIITLPLLDDELKCYVSTLHPLCHRDMITQDDLLEHGFILREQGSGTRVSFENLMYSHQLNWFAKASCSSFDSILELTAAGIGIGILSERVVKNSIHWHELKTVPLEKISFIRNFKIAYHRDSIPLDDYIQLCKNLLWV